MPRIVKRYESAFEALGLEFNKTRVSRLFLAKMAKEPAKVMPDTAILRFETLFGLIDQAHRKITARDAAPFR
jgi:hypothetical protein